MMARQLIIPYIPDFEGKDIESINLSLEDCGTLSTIECVNWPKEYSYMPITLFAVARTNTMLFIKFIVKGSMLKAVYSNDQEPVYEDSCVEFFCKLPADDRYMNFEFNCIGTCLASTRKSRNEDVVMRTPDEMKRILRYSSIGKRAFCEMEGMFEWELTVGIPFDLLGINGELPEKLLGNFYKCADNTNSMHFVSWSPIKTEHPDFHRPDFFGELYLR